MKYYEFEDFIDKTEGEILEAVKEDYRVYFYLLDKPKQNEEIIFEAMKGLSKTDYLKGNLMKEIPRKFRNNPEFMLKAMDIDAEYLNFAFKKLIENKDFALKAIEKGAMKNKRCYGYTIHMGSYFKNDIDIMIHFYNSEDHRPYFDCITSDELQARIKNYMEVEYYEQKIM